MTTIPASMPSVLPGSSDSTSEHPWSLVAPWWHWPTEPGGHGRETRPVFQKYETPDLVNTFLADPQLRLAFDTDADQVHRIVVKNANKFNHVPHRVTTGIRKLYLGSHHRHYLVACELHCDVPGFPAVNRAQVCEAGFVVRRRQCRLPATVIRDARAKLRRLIAARNRLAAVEAQIAQHQSRATGGVKLAHLEGKRLAATNVVAEHQTAVAEWAHSTGIERKLEGWIPQGKAPDGSYADVDPGSTSSDVAPLAGVGRWARVDEASDCVSEHVYPLYPLVADPTQGESDARGSTVYFGVVPTGSADVAADGSARFDDECVYEIRCFVRRHKPACPRTGSQCHCPVTWSEPTTGYQLASHFDLRGTSNRPVTMQLPDLHQLHSDALTLPVGSTGGVLMKAPQSMSPTGSSFPPGGSLGAGEICSFSIPLITIVATFVFKLFLPIVVLAFQLWFMLALKFCIPPELSLGASASAELDATMEISASLAASIDIGDPQTDITAAINGMMGAFDTTNGSTVGDRLLSTGQHLLRVRSAQSVVNNGLTPPGPSDLVFAPRVLRKDAHA